MAIAPRDLAILGWNRMGTPFSKPDVAPNRHGPMPTAALVAEARRLRRRQLAAEALAMRCVPGRHGLPPAAAERVRRHALERAGRLQSRFLRAIDSLVLADAFEDAMAVLREHRRPPSPEPPNRRFDPAHRR